jgi:stage II sporulation protein D
MKGHLKHLLALAATTVGLCIPAQANAEWVVEGRGFGHGVGMSQYGAFGFAEQGKDYKQILRHYYTGVRVDTANTKKVRVLIASGLGSVPFTGADKACGENLDEDKEYSFRLDGGNVELRNSNGNRISGCGDEGSAEGGKSVTYSGVGAYRGELHARKVDGSLYAINKVGLDSYVKGVIPDEVPPSWPQDALRAQAVAARSYALATTVNGDGYDLYDDTRSQVYGGLSAEENSTNEAARRTNGEVIKSGGDVAQAFFFSTSGGETENSEFGFEGGSPRSYLKSVNDPFDNASPLHKWKERFSQDQMESKLSGLFQGNLKKIRILKKGESPRIVEAKVVGSNGSSNISGPGLRFRLGLNSAWAKFEKR